MRCICYYSNENVDFTKRYSELCKLYGEEAYMKLALSKQDVKAWAKIWKQCPLEVVMDRVEEIDDVVSFGSVVDKYENYMG